MPAKTRIFSVFMLVKCQNLEKWANN
ncbi:hypothetical protein Gohar_010680 [Gossypium harknessii]|uniref:Uncharacterized protein n=1 Tax=Gossypium harknessii TaxID=34285 RepID=A0A7J9GRK9_9ROSI|nr:hypothetical protein [Gossypium harknessii]